MPEAAGERRLAGALWSNAGHCMYQLGHTICNLAGVRAGIAKRPAAAPKPVPLQLPGLLN